MKLKKTMTGLLCATMVLSASAVFADSTDQAVQAVTIASEISLEDEFLLGSFTAMVKEINEYSQIEGGKFISLEDRDNMPINMIVSKDTYIVENKKIAVGDTITGYYNANAPMIMIYPPQYSPFAVVVESAEQNVKVDLFNKDLVSSDNMLKLNISEDTKIVTKDGKEFTGELGDKKLAVVYTISTKSIPAQTTPSKVIVLSETIKEEESPLFDVETMNIVVNNKKINGPSAYTIKASNGHGVVMVPLRAVAKGLGFNVVWGGNEENIVVGGVAGENVFLKIASKDYTDFNGKIITLEAGPELKEGTTFVPLDFFKKVLAMNNAYVFEGQIDINNGEEMH